MGMRTPNAAIDDDSAPRRPRNQPITNTSTPNQATAESAANALCRPAKAGKMSSAR